ncbi:PAS domain S-box protein, partial [Acinetobacter baumannii]|nr:PAS domain S-box protein [Acinetobacter baumannii]
QDKAVGRSAEEMGLWISDAARAKFEATVRRAGSVLGLETCMRHEDGTEIDCLVSAERVVIGEDDYVLAVLQDITERKRSERELFTAIETVMAD